jgi:hypothetical protein
VEMGHGFAGIGTVVDDESEAARDTKFFGDYASREQQVAEDGFVGGCGFADAGDDGFRDDEEVDGGGGGDVVDHDAAVVLVFDLGGDFAVDDALEEGLGHWERIIAHGTHGIHGRKAEAEGGKRRRSF